MKKIILMAFSFLIILAISVVAYLFLNKERYYASSGEHILKIFTVRQNANFQAFGSFIDDPSAFQSEISNLSKEYEVYFEPTNLPKDYLTLLKEDSLPFLGRDRYRILLAMKYKENIHFWLANERGVIVKLNK